MSVIIGVKAEHENRILFYDGTAVDPSVGERVIVETAKGIGIAEVISRICTQSEDTEQSETEDGFLKSLADNIGSAETDPEKKPESSGLPCVIRKATADDIQHAGKNAEKEKEAYSVCQKKITEHKLEMKLVGVECMFDNSKILFYFTANGRVDFRSLVKDLASVFKTRIELRQIGVRDEARMIGGLGPCGRQLCCGSFLNEFIPVSIKMAKEQNLSLNPTKISGVCGRLMCCLKYEQEHYEQTRKRMPKVGKEIETPDGPGIVSELNIVKETIKVRIGKGDDYEIKEYSLDDIQDKNTAVINATVSGTGSGTSDTVQDKEKNNEPADNKKAECDTDPEISRKGNDTEAQITSDKKTVLGHVVRRENKHRNNAAEPSDKTRSVTTNSKDRSAGTKRNISGEENTVEDHSAGSSSWQEALNRAMKQAEQNT